MKNAYNFRISKKDDEKANKILKIINWIKISLKKLKTQNNAKKNKWEKRNRNALFI